MQKRHKVSVSAGREVNASDRASLRKRRWITPAVRKLKVDQTEAGIGAPDDGLDTS